MPITEIELQLFPRLSATFSTGYYNFSHGDLQLIARDIATFSTGIYNLFHGLSTIKTSSYSLESPLKTRVTATFYTVLKEICKKKPFQIVLLQPFSRTTGNSHICWVPDDIYCNFLHVHITTFLTDYMKSSVYPPLQLHLLQLFLRFITTDSTVITTFSTGNCNLIYGIATFLTVYYNRFHGIATFLTANYNFFHGITLDYL